MEDRIPEVTGSDRRTFIKRSAVVGGALVWAAPVVQTLAQPAFAAGTAACAPKVRTTTQGQCTESQFAPQEQACCDCIDEVTRDTGSAALAAGICTKNPRNPAGPCDPAGSSNTNC